MSRRFAGAGGLRRQTRSHAGGAASVVIPDDPYTVLGAALIHEYDAALNAAVGQWNSQRSADHLLQGTSAFQPVVTSAGDLSHVDYDGIDNRQGDNTVTNWGGDTTLIVVGKYNTAAAAAHMFTGGTSGGTRFGITGGDVSGFTARVTDGTGDDNITSGVAGDTALHIFVLRNATGVARKFYVDGGSGAAGVRTDGTATLSRTYAGSSPAAANFAHCSVYWAGIVRPSPTVANLNLIGAWATYRFGTAWSTLS